MFRRRRLDLLLGASLWTSSAGAQEQPQYIVAMTHERALSLANKQAGACCNPYPCARETEGQGDYVALGAATARAELAPNAGALR